MNEIRILSKETVEQIAAGEVIENPSCVVKELVENAIDAGARHIQIEATGGGIDSIRICDDGCGIVAEQVEKAFLPHATSKLSDIADLEHITTMGFRGEALSSIASVSRATMTTKPHDALLGVQVTYEGGKRETMEEIGAADGTTIQVYDLFYNTPARRKFLRSPQTEGSYVTGVVEHLALCNPNISFELIVNGRLRLSTSGNGNVRDAIYQIYGKEVAANLIDISAETSHLCVTGVIGKPLITRGTRALENYFINGRYIRSNILNKAIDDAYRPFMMLHQYPFTCLYLSIDGKETDVNVHPRKMELKFVEGNRIYAELLSVVKSALEHQNMIPREEDTDPEKPLIPDENGIGKDGGEQSMSRAHYAPFERRKLEAIVREPDGASPYQRIYDQIRPREEQREDTIYATPEAGGEGSVFEDVQVTLSDAITREAGYSVDFGTELTKNNFRLIGQLFDTYWLVEMEEQLFIIDQHAAHEKILFERNLKRFEERSFSSQQITPPFLLTLTNREADILEEHLSYFEELGFEIEPFGDDAYALSAVPDNLYGISYEAFLRECLELMEGERKKTPEVMWHRIATASCKAAIKGNMKKSAAEAEHLIRELMTLENPYHCPHGRPTIVSMSKSDIEKRFKRIV